jgi:hypothetical protein
VSIALVKLESTIDESQLEQKDLLEIKADIATMRAQLAKPNPSSSILKEAGASLRKVLEGAAGGMLAPGVTAAAKALWSALGIG